MDRQGAVLDGHLDAQGRRRAGRPRHGSCRPRRGRCPWGYRAGHASRSRLWTRAGRTPGKGPGRGSNLVTDIAASRWRGVCRGTMYGLGRCGPFTRQASIPAAPHSGLTTYVLTCEQIRGLGGVGGEGVHRGAGPGRQAPGQGPWPGETHVRQLQLPPDNASGDHGRLPPDPGAPWPPWAADPGVCP